MQTQDPNFMTTISKQVTFTRDQDYYPVLWQLVYKFLSLSLPGSTSTKKQAREVSTLARFRFFREIFFSSSLTELKCVWKENLIQKIFVMIPVLVADTIKNGGGGGKGGWGWMIYFLGIPWVFWLGKGLMKTCWKPNHWNLSLISSVPSPSEREREQKDYLAFCVVSLKYLVCLG